MITETMNATAINNYKHDIRLDNNSYNKQKKSVFYVNYYQ